MTARERERRVALYDLLTLPIGWPGQGRPTPDPPDLITPAGCVRGNHVTYERDPLRDPNIIKRDLGTAYVEHCRHDRFDISGVVAVHTVSKLRLLKRA